VSATCYIALKLYTGWAQWSKPVISDTLEVELRTGSWPEVSWAKKLTISCLNKQAGHGNYRSTLYRYMHEDSIIKTTKNLKRKEELRKSNIDGVNLIKVHYMHFVNKTPLYN
jgi:hypothetical protein